MVLFGDRGGDPSDCSWNCKPENVKSRVDIDGLRFPSGHALDVKLVYIITSPFCSTSLALIY